MKIWHFSDTHTLHNRLIIPDNIDIAIFSGDCSNPRDPYTNEHEVLNFLMWFGMTVKAKYKIMIAGNHDSSIEARLIKSNKFKEYGIIYLENESIKIEDIKIWGSPYTPMFNNWSFMRDRNKLNKLWQSIPEDTNIVVVHGPPKGCLDLSYNRLNELEFCGCSALKKRIMSIQPELCLFGHIHNFKDIYNAGTMQINNCKTIFSNGAILEDGKFQLGPINNGNILEI